MTRRVYKPMLPATWEARTRYLEQAKAHHRNPSKPEANIELLTVGPHGPFRTIATGMGSDGKPYVSFTVQNEGYKPRFGPPLVFLTLDLLLAFGGGCSVNDNHTGFAYVRLFGGHDKQMLGRILLDTQPGEVAKQHTASGERTDYHNNDPAWFSKTTAESVEAEGKRTNSPQRGRKYAIETALRYFQKNHWRSGINITEAEYLRTLEDAFTLLDATHGHHLNRSA